MRPQRPFALANACQTSAAARPAAHRTSGGAQNGEFRRLAVNRLLRGCNHTIGGHIPVSEDAPRQVAYLLLFAHHDRVLVDPLLNLARIGFASLLRRKEPISVAAIGVETLCGAS